MNRPADPPAAAAESVSALGIALVLARLLVGGTAFVAFLGLFARWSSFAEITTHFLVFYAISAAFAVVFALLARQKLLTAGAAAILIWALTGIVPWYLHAPARSVSGGHTIKILTANVELRNTDHDPLLALVAREAPDVVFLQEVTPVWFESFKDLYRYRIEVPHRGYFGLALYSRFPIDNVAMDDPVGRDVPILRADVDVNGRMIHVINLHLPSPERRELIEIRTAQWAWLTEYVAQLDGPAIVAGDFNCTMWSPLYTDLTGRGKLASAREGHGLMPTWFPLGGSLHLLPIDHILARGVHFTDARLGERIGSDHNPLIADVRIPPA